MLPHTAQAIRRKHRRRSTPDLLSHQIVFARHIPTGLALIRPYTPPRRRSPPSPPSCQMRRAPLPQRDPATQSVEACGRGYTRGGARAPFRHSPAPSTDPLNPASSAPKRCAPHSTAACVAAASTSASGGEPLFWDGTNLAAAHRPLAAARRNSAATRSGSHT
ncbi:hypothetical protein GQ55_6G177400 [Panicum hallii var. hallii]|uniref:Uncharacterized protein n=1 Tax=Panicum hallii var. hallii TaxID=1504633 RepID=A0A2T7D713_9POAL|nr:hypothetical protein GQ55_6G177400 [Panicum hallii var. hallii]